MSTVIEDVMARKVFNSRGAETLEVDIVKAVGFGRAAAPAGASVGKAEVLSYPEGGVDQAIKNVEDLITPELIDMNADMQESIDLSLHEIHACMHAWLFYHSRRTHIVRRPERDRRGKRGRGDSR